MDFKKLADRAKNEAKGAQAKAKGELDRRGGTAGLKASASRVAGAAKGSGSIGDKAKSVTSAVKTEAKR